MLASVARACSAGPMHLHVRWASTAADRVASSEQSKWAAILDPLYLHPSSPMAHSVDSAQHPLAATPRPTFAAVEDEGEHGLARATNRRRLADDSGWDGRSRHPTALELEAAPGGAAVVPGLALALAEAAAASAPRSPTPRPTDAQAAWAAAFTDACTERQARGSAGSSCRGGRAQTADASWLSAQGPPSPRRAASLPNLHLRSQ